MSKGLSESTIVKKLAEQVCRHLTHRTIAALQRMEHTLSGDDSPLNSTWDEICAQLQNERSVAWEVYDETVRDLVNSYLEELPPHERDALWLQTDEGFDWDCDAAESREPCPVINQDIVDYIVQEHVYAKAADWSNARIRAYLERANMTD